MFDSGSPVSGADCPDEGRLPADGEVSFRPLVGEFS
jgi:hypothetical protein